MCFGQSQAVVLVNRSSTCGCDCDSSIISNVPVLLMLVNVRLCENINKFQIHVRFFLFFKHMNFPDQARLETVHKRRPQSGGGSLCPVRTFFGQGGEGVLQMRTSALFGAKNFGFFEIYGMSKRTRGEPIRTFFAILNGRLLWAAPYAYYLALMLNIIKIYDKLELLTSNLF